MILLLVMTLFACGMYVVAARAGKSGNARTRVLRNGTDARGIILSADRTASSKTTLNGVRYESRAIRLDIEVPGRAPYELSLTPLIPRICDAFPGSTLDLRVDPADPSNIAILGPAGSVGWMNAMPLLFPRIGPGASGCAKPIFALVFVPFIALFAVLSFVGEGDDSEKSHGGSHSLPAGHDVCEAEARCCNKIGPPGGCKSFKTMPSSACQTALESERRVAGRLKKVCE
jgi:hypothetical protein